MATAWWSRFSLTFSALQLRYLRHSPTVHFRADFLVVKGEVNEAPAPLRGDAARLLYGAHHGAF
jgi:hypothetical protein